MNKEVKKYIPEAIETGKKLFGDEGAVRKLFDSVAELDSDFSRLLQEFGWAGMYARKILDDKTKELCSVAALTVLGQWPQLRDHIKFALRMGASEKEVLEVILQMCVFGGFPVMFTALGIFREVRKDLGKTN
jgi:4-carboxymuconolactone decarboxylase